MLPVSAVLELLDALKIPPTRAITRAAAYDYPTPEAESTTVLLSLRADANDLLGALSLKVATLNAYTVLPDHRTEAIVGLVIVSDLVSFLGDALSLRVPSSGRLFTHPEVAVKLPRAAGVEDALLTGDLTLPASADALTSRLDSLQHLDRAARARAPHRKAKS